MKIKDIFDLGIKMGVKADFRGPDGVQKLLERRRKMYEKLDKQAKADFDQEALVNPYLDSRVLNIARDKTVKRVLVGIDIEPAEILLSKELDDIDLIIAHHPEGVGLAHLADVMALQVDVLNQYGVPVNVAEGLMKIRISEVARGINAINHERAVDMARLLGVNFICLHTPCDNLAARFLRDIVEGSGGLEYVDELMDLLKGIPEYQVATKIGAGPKLYAGSSDNRCGKIAITEMTGGTEGSPKLYEKLAQVGVGTVVGMHQSEEHRKEAEASHLNVVIAGHISSDSLGVNIFLDELERGGVTIVPCSGLIRVSRLNRKKRAGI